MKPVWCLAIGCVVIVLLGAPAGAAPEAPGPVTLISAWVDHHDRIAAILNRLSPGISVSRVDLEREGSRGSLDWWPAFGFPDEIDLTGRLLILENAPYSGLSRLTDSNGGALDSALPNWVRSGGHLLIVGGSPSIESYAKTPLAELMGFDPSEDTKRFIKRKRRDLSRRGGNATGVFVEHLHTGELSGARVVLYADRQPFLIEHSVGRGRVTTVLSGAQGGLRKDGGEPADEFFESTLWESELLRIVSAAHAVGFSIGPAAPLAPEVAAVRPEAFDIRFFMISHQPSPYTLAPGEAYERARRLRGLGFTSTVFAANSTRPLDTRRALEEIAQAGLRIVYYDGVRPQSPAARFWKTRAKPARATSLSGKDTGWDVHSEEFRGAIDRLFDGRSGVSDLPLRAVQLIEEFKDGDSVGPSLAAAYRAEGISKMPRPRDASRFKTEMLRDTATHETFQAFRSAGKRLFPGVPQATYWPGSYWRQPNAYGYRLSTLGDAVDEVMAPGYGYSSPRRGRGPATVRWSANSGWSVLRDSASSQPHLAIYGMGRPLKRKSQHIPGLLAWRETAWTSLAHGSTGLAYWALPESEAIAGLGPLHDEVRRLGPWLAAPAREPARVAMIQSWTSRGDSGDVKAARFLDQCLQDSHEALELGFEDVDLVLEERLDRMSDETQGLVLMGSPAISSEAADALVVFLDRGGQLFRDPGSGVRTQPGNQNLDLENRTRRPSGIHTVPMMIRCHAVRFSHQRAGQGWRDLLQSAGIEPRFRTPELETEAGLRGNAELVHVYGLNHAEEDKVVTVDLESQWAARTWVELRSGVRFEMPPSRRGRLRSEMIAPGEAVIWASVARPMDRVSVDFERMDEGMRFRVVGFDAQGRGVTDGYPIEFELGSDSSCIEGTSRSATLVSGEVSLAWMSCSMPENTAVGWVVIDPISGRRWQAAEAKPVAVMP